MNTPDLETCRYYLKDYIRQAIDFSQVDQSRGLPPPPVEKPFDPGATRIDLTPADELGLEGKTDFMTLISDRQSRRNYAEASFSLNELSFLLWATQGVTTFVNPAAVKRTVPSAGCRHALETYIGVMRVEGLAPGMYRYLPVEHQLVLEFEDDGVGPKLAQAALGQQFIGRAAVTFVWTTIPIRMEWRYGLASHKVIALDAGHVCQNLYLACEVIDAGTCAVAAYDQDAMDRLLRVDGKDEFAIYLAAAGKRHS